MKYLLYCVILLGLFQSNISKEKVERNKTKIEVNNALSDTLVEPTYQEVLKEYDSTCSKVVRIDTNLRLEGTVYKIRFKHYCLFDTLIIPSKYNWGQPSKDFYAHNFVSKLIVVKGNDTIVDTIIRKDMFNPLLYGSLVKYGVLFDPNFMGYNNLEKVIQFQYSISVPLTDVGKSVFLDIGLNGKIKTTEE